MYVVMCRKARSNAKMNVGSDVPAAEAAGNDGRDDEAALCDLHFIADCQSCSNWDRHRESIEGGDDEDEDKDDTDWMTHALSFAKDRLGKDLTWKRKNEEELVVIDPRERERRKAVACGGGFPPSITSMSTSPSLSAPSSFVLNTFRIAIVLASAIP